MTGSRAVIAAVIVALGLAGCSSEDPEPKVAPSTPSSPSTSTVAEPEAPELPDAADLTRGGAEQFVRAWFGALSEGMVSGDTHTVREYSADRCGSCLALIEQIDGLYAKGGRVETAGWAVDALRLNGRFSKASPSFILRVDQARRVLLDGEKVVDETPRALVPMHVVLGSPSGTWTVAELEIIE